MLSIYASVRVHYPVKILYHIHASFYTNFHEYQTPICYHYYMLLSLLYVVILALWSQSASIWWYTFYEDQPVYLSDILSHDNDILVDT